jgi:hypothetical protein
MRCTTINVQVAADGCDESLNILIAGAHYLGARGDGAHL